MKTASPKAGKEARRSPQQSQEQRPKPKGKGRRIVMTHFPHSKAGRPRLVEDMVGTPI